MAGIPGLAPLQEGTVHVDPYMREGHPVAGYQRVLDVMRALRDPLSPTNEAVMPNGARVTMPDTSRASMLHVSLPDRGGYQQVTAKTGDELFGKVLKAAGGTRDGDQVRFEQFDPADRPIGTGTFGAATSGPLGKPLPHAPGRGTPTTRPPGPGYTGGLRARAKAATAGRRRAGDSVSGTEGIAFGTHPAADLGTGTGGREEPQGIPGLPSVSMPSEVELTTRVGALDAGDAITLPNGVKLEPVMLRGELVAWRMTGPAGDTEEFARGLPGAALRVARIARTVR